MLFGALLACIAPHLDAPTPRASAPVADAPASDKDVTGEVWRLLGQQTSGKPIDELAAARSIARLGDAAVRPTLGIYLGLVAEPETEAVLDERSMRARPRILLAALAALPPFAVLEEIDRTLSMQDGVDLRLGVVRILGRSSVRGALLRVVRIASELEPLQWESSFVQEPLEGALGALLTRDKRAASQLAARVQSVDPALGAIFVRSLVRASAAHTASALTDALGRDARLDLCVVDALGEFGDRISGTLPHATSDRLLALLQSEDTRLVAAAARTLAVLGEPDSAVRLVDLLDHPDSGVRAAATTGLRELTQLSLGSNEAAWRARLESEALWAAETLPQLVLADPDASTLSRVVADLRQHMLYRHRGAELVTRALASEDPSIVLFALSVLPEFRSGVAQPALRALEDDGDVSIRRAARAALDLASGSPASSR